MLAIHALLLLDDLDGVELLITADEEVGSKASRALIEERALACGAVLVMEPSADGGALKTARKGTGTFEVVVHGKAAHAGLEPEKGINSLVAAAQLITRIATFGDPEKGTTVTPDRCERRHRRQRRAGIDDAFASTLASTSRARRSGSST